MENLNEYVIKYQEQLKQGNILIAYNALVKFVMSLRTSFIKRHANQYTISGMLHGYLDYTYFYYSNSLLKSKKLKFGLVLNHMDMRFEIWLLGNTMPIQKKYWELLKTSKWNGDTAEMPKYAVLEIILVQNPDFNNLNALTEQIETKMIEVTEEILDYIRTLEAEL